MSFDPHALKIYVDGSCFGNPGGNGGFAAWLEFPVDWNQPNQALEEIGFHETTNNRMELQACIWAHDWIRQQDASLDVGRVQIVTDSKYVYDNYRPLGDLATLWVAKWMGQANGECRSLEKTPFNP